MKQPDVESNPNLILQMKLYGTYQVPEGLC